MDKKTIITIITTTLAVLICVGTYIHSKEIQLGYAVCFWISSYYFLTGAFRCCRVRTFPCHLLLRAVFFEASGFFFLYSFWVVQQHGDTLIPMHVLLFLMLVPIQSIVNGIRVVEETKCKDY